MPIKKTPDIADIIGDKLEKSDEPAASDFASQWQSMFTKIYSSVPTIYIPFKDSLPEIENNTISFVVKNEIQKEHFEAKKREAVEFLHNNYNLHVNDIIVETNERLETKKIIYDVKDKMQNFMENNDEFDDFVQILDIKIKD